MVMKRSPLLGLVFLFATSVPGLANDEPDARTTELDRQEAELRALYAAYETGLNAAGEGDMDTALREFRNAAEQGLDVAQYNLGILYYSGNGVRQDYYRAYQWIRAAADQGHVAAMFNMGVLYFNGQGMNPRWMSFWPLNLINMSSNMQEAARWYQQAANLGHGGASFNLATMYRDGFGVERDLVLAWKWAWVSRESDYPAASQLVTSLSRELSPEQLEQARTLYAEWELTDNY
jgi:TPR repeat protein